MYSKFGFCWLFFMLLILSSCKEKPVSLSVVEVESPTLQDVEIYGEYVGSIRAKKNVEVRARVDGFLEQKLFEEGKKVKEGELLFVIDPSQYIARLNKAKAQLLQAKAAAAKAERDVIRLKPLYEKKAASQLDLDNAISGVESENANVEMVKSDVEQAELELSFTKVRAPVSGYVGERKADVGALVGSGGISLLTNVVQTDTITVNFSLTALDYLKCKQRNLDLSNADTTRSWQPTVTITLADRKVYPIKGIVDFARPEVDTKTGTFSVRAELLNPNRDLLPGQFTRVKLLLDVIEDAIVVPRKSIIIEKGGVYIYTMRRDSTVEKRFIQTGAEVGNKIVVDKGLSAYEKIITEGQNKLSPGLRIIPTSPTDSIWVNKPKK